MRTTFINVNRCNANIRTRKSSMFCTSLRQSQHWSVDWPVSCSYLYLALFVSLVCINVFIETASISDEIFHWNACNTARKSNPNKKDAISSQCFPRLLFLWLYGGSSTKNDHVCVGLLIDVKRTSTRYFLHRGMACRFSIRRVWIWRVRATLLCFSGLNLTKSVFSLRKIPVNFPTWKTGMQYTGDAALI